MTLYSASLDYIRKRLPVFPLKGKKPAVKLWQQFEATRVNARTWFKLKRCNIGLRTGEYIVIDTDTEEAESWVEENGISSPMMVRTGSGGIHRFFRTKQEVRNRQGLHGIHGLDIRGDGGYVVFPPSIHPNGEKYQFLTGLLPVEELPLLDPTWLATRIKKREVTTPVVDNERRIRAENYIAKIKAVSGEGGHNATFRATCKLRDFGLSKEESRHLLHAWNATNAIPPWSEKELEHKLNCVFGGNP